MSDQKGGNGVTETSPTDPPKGGKQDWMTGTPRERASATQAVPPGLQYSFFGKTHVGLVRDHNEDNFMATDLESPGAPLTPKEPHSGAVSERGVAFAVCDGMGGAAAGEVASQMAVDTLYEILRGEEPAPDRDDFARRLVHAIEEAGVRIFKEAKRDRTRRGMGTTATAAALIDKVLFVGQVGDSRCYILRGGRLSLLTKDQSLVNQLIEAGQLTEDEAVEFEHSNIILQALGTTERVAVDLTFVELRRGDRLLLCSDGLCGLVHDDVIQEEMACIGSLPVLADRLIDLANAAGGHDNVTCIVVDFDGEDLPEPESEAVPFYQQYPLPAGEGDDADAAPNHGPVIKSILPRPMPGVREVMRRRGPARDPGRELSWLSATAVLFAFGIAAVIAISASSKPPIPSAFAAPSLPSAYPDSVAPVAVSVRSSLEQSDLYVNGRNYGPLRSGESVLLELVPGAYQIEARKGDGTSVAQVVLVQPDSPEAVTLAAKSEQSQHAIELPNSQ